MKCPHCKQDNDRVVDSRIAHEGAVIRRRRECLSCYLRYTTYERVEETPLRVIKKSGERVRFERERMLNGMALACEKLPVSMEELAMNSTSVIGDGIQTMSALNKTPSMGAVSLAIEFCSPHPTLMSP